MNKTCVLIEFKNGLISFFDELIDQFPQEPDLIMIRIFLKDQIPIEDVIIRFNEEINKDGGTLKKMIKEKNELFFLENDIFAISKTKTSHFKKLWRSGVLDDEDKKVVWTWLSSFVYLGDKYIKASS